MKKRIKQEIERIRIKEQERRTDTKPSRAEYVDNKRKGKREA